MKLIPFIIPLMAVVTRADQSTVTYNSTYDNAVGFIHDVKCGSKLEKNYTLFGQLPTFPDICGSSIINPNTGACGSCWRLSDATGDKKVNVIVINDAQSGGASQFQISRSTFKKLTGQEPVNGNQGLFFTAEPVDEAECKLNPVS